jgi:oxygen-independent coproporphyrinogen-3 oxidase
MNINKVEPKPTNPWEVFGSRVRSANQARHILPYKPVPETERYQLLESLLQKNSALNNRVIYVHIPFCKSLCPFCIYSKQKMVLEEIVNAYCETLIKQIQNVSATGWAKSAPFKAIFFGGGTPTAIPAENLTQIIRNIKKYYPLTNDCEITVESTISEITPGLCEKMQDAGVNRISLGVQSFNTEIRKKLGRKSTTEGIFEAIDTIKKSGFNNIAIDLIYMLEGQTMETWKNDLQLLSGAPITGCSVYPLITKPGNQNVPENLEQEYHFFAEADSFLAELNGWKRFTPVQYGHGKNGNASYVTSHGQNADMLAFGTGAGGRMHNFMYLQGTAVNEFIKNGQNLIKALMIGMVIDEKFLEFRTIFELSERMHLEKNVNENAKKYFGDIIENLIEAGLVDEDENNWFLTKTGRFWGANISALFSERIKSIITG